MRRLLCLFLLIPALANAAINYRLTPDVPARTYAVSIQVTDPGKQIDFQIPAWTPGYYQILKYQDKISDVRAIDAKGAVLRVDGSSPRTWKVANPSGGAVTLNYRVLADDAGLGFFYANLVAHTGFINGASTFMYVVGRKPQPVTLKIEKMPADWKVATGMDQNVQGVFTAGDYDEFIDHPIQMGIFAKTTFTSHGLPFEVIFVGTSPQVTVDTADATAQLQKTTDGVLDVFEGKASFKRYVYFVHLSIGNFGGGLEHRASTVLNVGGGRRGKLYLSSLAAHEFFHAWNVKQIRPRVLGPFDYTQTVRTGNLWFAEGVTDYYADLVTYRTGFIDQRGLLGALGNEINTLMRGSTRKKTALEEVSWQTWDDSGFDFGDASYYTWGKIVGLLLDAKIRTETEGKKSLDDVMRAMYAKHMLPKPGYEETGILAVVNEVAGVDCSQFYNRLVKTTDDPSFEILKSIGLRVASDGSSWRLELDPNASAQAVDLRNQFLKLPGQA